MCLLSSSATFFLSKFFWVYFLNIGIVKGFGRLFLTCKRTYCYISVQPTSNNKHKLQLTLDDFGVVPGLDPCGKSTHNSSQLETIIQCMLTLEAPDPGDLTDAEGLWLNSIRLEACGEVVCEAPDPGDLESLWLNSIRLEACGDIACN